MTTFRKISAFFKNELLWILLIFGLSLVLRTIYARQNVSNPMFVLSPAELAHIEGWSFPGPLFHSPLFTYFTAALFNIFARHAIAVRISFFVIGAINTVLIYFAAKKVFGITIARIASFIAVIYAPFMFFEGEISDPLLSITLGLVFFIVALNALRSASKWKWFLCGMLWALSILSRHHFFLFGLSLAVYLAIKFLRKKERVFLIYLICFILGFIITISPITIRNIVVGKDIVVIGYVSGVAFWHGNNPDFEELRDKAYGFGWKKILDMAFTEGGVKKPSEASRFFFKKALKFMHEEPWEYLKLQFRKLYNFWYGYETMGDDDIYAYRPYSPLLAVLVGEGAIFYPFGVIGPLCIIGMILSTRKTRETLLLTVMILTCMFLDVYLVIQSRYRISTVPFMLIPASYTLWWWWQEVKHRNFQKKFFMTITLFVILLIAFNFPRPKFNRVNVARVYYKMAGGYYARGNIDACIDGLEKAWAVYPDNPEAMIPQRLAFMYEKMKKNPGKAISYYQKAVKLEPANANTRLGLANIYCRDGKISEALFEYNTALQLRLSPDQQMLTHFNLGTIYKQLKDYRNAMMHFMFVESHAIGNARYRSNEIAARYNLAELYENTGRNSLAMQEYEKLSELNPNDHLVKVHLERLRKKARGEL